MIDLSYEDRLEAAYQEGRTAALSGSTDSRFTAGTPMHGSWLEGWNEAASDRGWQPIGTVAKRVVQRIRVCDED